MDDIDIELDSTVSADEPDNDHESILSHADSDIDILTSTAAFIDQDVTADSDDFDNTEIEITDDCFHEEMFSDHSNDIDTSKSNNGTNFGNTVKTKSKHAKYNASNNTPCVDGRILVAFLYVASRRNYLRHFIAASRTQF